MNTNWEQRRQPRITRMTRIKGATAEIDYGAGRGYFDRMNRIFRMGLVDSVEFVQSSAAYP